MTYQDALAYLGSFINYERITAYPYRESLKLERIKDFLQLIGSPQDGLSCIHVAGTKGKGSTCAFISYILKEAGYKTGLYTSPHLFDFRERIRVLYPKNNKPEFPLDKDFEGMIPQGDLARLVEKLSPEIEEYNKKSKYGALSFFEAYTAIAFFYFKEEKVDFAVLETGLGGRLDATNTVSPLACVLTPISYEHTQKLGSTLREIASEKAGIIKYATAVISSPQEGEAEKIIREKCRECNAQLYMVAEDIICRRKGSSFDIKGICGEYKDLKIRMLGAHQMYNAAAAVGAIESLMLRDIKIGAQAIKKGLSGAFWPGRLEIISEEPLVVLDGAQNVASAVVMREAVKGLFKYKRLILVLGISSDKDIKGVCSELYGLADEVVLTRSSNPRAASPKKLSGYFSGKKLYFTASVKEARSKAYDLAGRDDLILVCGSLFVVGEFRHEALGD